MDGLSLDGLSEGMARLSQGPRQCVRYQRALIPVTGHKLSGEPLIATGVLAESGRGPVIVAPDHGDADHERWKAGFERASCKLLSTAPKHSVILDAPSSVLRDADPVSEDECGEPPELATDAYTLGFCSWIGHRFCSWLGQGPAQIRKDIVPTTDERLICVNTLTTGGNSGGAVWEAESGRLIGTIQMSHTNEDLTAAAPVADWTQVIW
jgi:hypothetical protein